jgi:hypothetical protein
MDPMILLREKAKLFTHKKPGLLKPLPIPSGKWLSLSLDFITGLPDSSTSSGQKLNNLPVAVDRLTKYKVLIPCGDTSSQ